MKNPIEACDSTDCVGCSCCFGLLIDVTGSDVHRLARSLALDPNAFVGSCTSDETDDDIGFSLEAGGPTYTLVLRQRAGAHDRALIAEHGRPCTFLLGPVGGATRCGVYADRPRACRSYPAEVLAGEVVVRSIARCPVGTKVVGRAWRDDVRNEQIEGDLHRIVVWRWNRHVYMADRPQRLGDYLRYLLAVHDQLQPAWSSIVNRADWATLREVWGGYLDDGHSAFLSAGDDVPALAPIAHDIACCVGVVESMFPGEATW